MKIIAIIGSPHGVQGHNGRIADAVLDAARKAGAETEAFSLAQLSLKPCKGCYACAKTGTCGLSDSYARLRQELLNADGIILTSPNYVFNVSSQMKLFIDRSFSMMHCQLLKDKYSAVIVTSGGPEFKLAKQYLQLFLRMNGCWSVGGIGVSEFDLDDATEGARILTQAAALGKRMVRAIAAQASFPRQQANKDYWFEIWKFLVAMNKNEFPFEYEHWKKCFGLDNA